VTAAAPQLNDTAMPGLKARVLITSATGPIGRELVLGQSPPPAGLDAAAPQSRDRGHRPSLYALGLLKPA
jgi:hypothetical protein